MTAEIGSKIRGQLSVDGLCVKVHVPDAVPANHNIARDARSCHIYGGEPICVTVRDERNIRTAADRRDRFIGRKEGQDKRNGNGLARNVRVKIL